MRSISVCDSLNHGLPMKYRGEKGPRARRAMRETPFELYQFDLTYGAHKAVPKLSVEHLQAEKPMRSKQIVTVPLQTYFGFH